MKLLIVFACLAFFCMIQSAPTPSPPPRQIILQDYNSEDEVPIIEDDGEDETSSTTTTTRRSTYVFPSRTRTTLTSRRPWLTPRTSSVRTTTISEDEIHEQIVNDYEGDFRHFGNIRNFIKKIIEDLKKFFRNINLSDIIKAIQSFFNRKDDD